MNDVDVCPRCKGTVFYEKERSPHIGVYCKECDKWICWKKQPMTYDKAVRMVMPFGKHKGDMMGDIPDDYLEYIVDNFDDGKVKDAAVAVLSPPR